MHASVQNSGVPEYDNNLLITACGPILSREELALHLNHWPRPPACMDGVPSHISMHQMMALRSLHIPPNPGLGLAQMIDVMLRQGYIDRNPRDVGTWQNIYEGGGIRARATVPSLAAYVAGISGTGKSQAVERTLMLYRQTILHEKFPRMASPFKQLVWLKVDVPQSGSAKDLADVLMSATDEALGTESFKDYLKSRKTAGEKLRYWVEKARAHFLGLLVLDEISNLFKIASIDKRRKATKRKEPLLLSVADDETLKFILNFNNTSRIPLVAIGTPDGMAAFSKRLGTAERLSTGGFHRFQHSANADDPFFMNQMFPKLCEYQWFAKRMEASNELRKLLHSLSAGVPRIYINLWCLAHVCAFARMGDSLSQADLIRASQTYMAPLLPAVEALLSDNPEKMMEYEDLLPRDDAFWASLFGSL